MKREAEEEWGGNDFRSPDHAAAAEPNGFRRSYAATATLAALPLGGFRRVAAEIASSILADRPTIEALMMVRRQAKRRPPIW